MALRQLQEISREHSRCTSVGDSQDSSKVSHFGAAAKCVAKLTTGSDWDSHVQSHHLVLEEGLGVLTLYSHPGCMRLHAEWICGQGGRKW